MKTILESNRKRVDIRVLEDGGFEVYMLYRTKYDNGMVQEDCVDIKRYKSEKAVLKRANKFMNE